MTLGIIGATLAAVVIIGSLPILRNRIAGGRVGPGSAQSIAALPLANLSNDRAQEYFSDGITEDINLAHALVPSRSDSRLRRLPLSAGVGHRIELTRDQ